MAKYTTGEAAKLCGVTVRTVQYYDARDILKPSELSEGGRRLYSEADIRRLRIICFLREAGLSINSISDLLSESDPGSVINTLLDEQERIVCDEMAERQARLDRVEGIRRELKRVENFSVESLGDIAYTMENRKQSRQMHMIMLLAGIPMATMEWGAVSLWIVTGIWWPFALYALMIVPFGVWIMRFYRGRVGYICPECHEVFNPSMKQLFCSRHTPAMRRLICPHCGYQGFCVEIYKKERKNNNA